MTRRWVPSSARSAARVRPSLGCGSPSRRSRMSSSSSSDVASARKRSEMASGLDLVGRSGTDPRSASNWTRRQVLLTNLRAIRGRAYPRYRGLFREKSWVLFEILLPFLSTSAFVFVYRALHAPEQYVGFVVVVGALTAVWINVIWMMANQLYWEKSQGNLELYFAAPMHFMSILFGMALGGMIMSTTPAIAVLGIATALFGGTFAAEQWLLVIAVFVATLAAPYGVGTVLRGLFSGWGRDAYLRRQFFL